MGVWAVVKKYINSTTGTPDARPLDQIIDEKLNWLRRYTTDGTKIIKEVTKVVVPQWIDPNSKIIETQSVMFDRQGLLNLRISVKHEGNSINFTQYAVHTVTVTHDGKVIMEKQYRKSLNSDTTLNEADTIELVIHPYENYTISSAVELDNGGSVGLSGHTITHTVSFIGDLTL